MAKPLTTLIGRCSLFHVGHAHLIDRAIESSDFLLILIGSSKQVRTIKNPFTFEERAEVIRDYIQNKFTDTLVCIDPNPENNVSYHGLECGVLIMPLHDHPYNDLEWITEVQNCVTKAKHMLPIHADADVYLTGADRDASTWYLNAFGDLFVKDFITDSPHGLELNATALRDSVFDTEGACVSEYVPDFKYTEFHSRIPDCTFEFLQEFIKTEVFQDLIKEQQFVQRYKKAWAAAPYAPIFVTVDTCVIQSGHILVNVRDNFPGRGLWALPGGFLEQDEKMIDGAIRELIEETSIELSKAQLYGSIKAQQIFDYPGRSLRGRTITQCFLLKLDDSKSLPKVKPQKGEVQKLMWLPINEALANTDKWFEDHLEMVKWGVKECNR